MEEYTQINAIGNPEAVISRLKESLRLLQLVLRKETRHIPAPESDQ